MATHNFIPRNNYTIVVITLCFFHLIFCSVTAKTIINNINGGFSAHLIRKNSPNSQFREHKNQKVSRRLIGSDIPEAPIRIDEENFEHIMKLSVGTPPVDVYLIADTGSDLLWTQCEPCVQCYKTKFANFDLRKSSTFKNITCRSRECRNLGEFFPQDLVNKCRAKPTGNCVYGYSYVDDASTSGVLGKETISLNSTNGEVVALKNIVFGCGMKNKENHVTGSSTGVIGLGRGPLSFVSQIGPYVGGKKFSHCFVSDFLKSDSKIYFGKGSEVLGEGVVTVPLVDRKDKKSRYFVTVTGMSIDNDFVPFNTNGASAKKGNMMIDSGTPFGHLTQEMFDQVATQLKKTIPLNSFFKDKQLCFNTTGPFKRPAMAFHFENGAKLPLIDQATLVVEEGATCFQILTTTQDDYGYIGGIQQIDFHVGFDLDRNVVSFKPTNCADHIKSNIL